MTYIQFGNLTLPSLWLAVLTALFAGSLISRLLTGQKVGDWYWNSIFLYLLTWKLSYILFNFSLFLDMPLSIIYFNGGIKGHFLALTVLSIYLLFQAGKKHPEINQEVARIFLLFYFTYEVISTLLEKQWIEGVFHFLLLAVYLAILLSLNQKKKRFTGSMIIVMMLLEILFFSLFNTLLSIEPLTFIWIGLTGLVLSTKMKKEVEIHE